MVKDRDTNKLGKDPREHFLQSKIFRRFADPIPEIIFEIDNKGNINYLNKKGLKAFKVSEEIVRKGLTISALLDEEQAQTIASNLKEIKNPGDSVQNEYVFRLAEGSELSVISHTFGYYDNDSNLLGFRGILTDISARKAAREEIEREKSYLETLFNSSPDSIVQTSITGIIERVNLEFVNEFGFEPEEAIGQSVDELIIPEDLRKEARKITTKASGNEEFEVETVRKRKDGSLVEVSMLVKPIKLNKEVTALYAIYRNITEEKMAAVTRDIIFNISNAALVQTELVDIYKTIRKEIGRIWNTKNLFIVLYNQETKSFTLPLYEDEKDDFEEIPAKGTLTGWLINHKKPVLLKEKQINILEDKSEVELIGTPCKVWLGVPLKIGKEIVGAMVLQDYDNENAFSRDDLRLLGLVGNQIAIVIQRQQILSNLVIERKKAEEAAQAKQQFMSTMSHEIRTPLNEVIGISNLLLQGKPREDQMEFVKTLRFSGNHLLTLVNDILDFNKIESGMIVFEKTQFNLREFIKEIERSYSFKSDGQALEFRIKLDDALPEEVLGDSVRLNQVLSNLLSNAFKFTSKGYIELEVILASLKDKTASVKFSVNDSGIGIPADKHETIFETYTQASDDTTRKFGGTGLGLSICKKLIELQGSKIKIDSTPGIGSKFFFTLDFTVAKAPKRKQISEEDEELQNELTGKRVLIAEDNKINFFVANKFLTKWGIEVSHAEDGKIALEMIEKNEYDLILMDLHMPVMDGIEATRKIRESADKQIASLPVVALTAAILSDTEARIEGLKINDYILKPFKPNELYDKILRNTR